MAIQRNTPLKRKTPLKRSTKPIARKTPLKPSQKPLKRSPIKRSQSVTVKATLRSTQLPKKSTKPMAKLKADADKWFSIYVRHRDGRYSHARGWETKCITCGKWAELKKMQAGHFVSRAISELRFDEENVNGQCYGCNVMHSGQLHYYYEQLDVKYGEGTAARLLARRMLIHKFTRAEFEQIISDAQTCIEHLKLKEGDNLVNTTKPKQKTITAPHNTAVTNDGEPADKKIKRRKMMLVQK